MNPFHSIIKSPLSFACVLTAVLVAGCGGSNLDPVLGTPGAVVTLPAPVVPVVPVVPADARPTVLVTSPTQTEANVAVNRTMTAVFSEGMAPASLSGTSFTVTNTTLNAPVAGSVTYSASSRTATFTPTAVLPSASQYLATITTAATDVAGNALAGNAATFPNAGIHTWNFSTGLAPDTTRPTVTVTVPDLAETDVPTTRPITAVFSEGMAPASLTETSFTVATAGSAVPGTVTYSAADRRATFVPNSALATATQFTATILATATDLAGNGLSGNSSALPAASDFTWNFTTAQAPDTVRPTVTDTLPGDEEANVVISRNITAVFSEAMAPASIPTSFTVAPSTAPTVPLEGVVTYSSGDNTATLNPTVDLLPGTQYTATISTAATDLAANGIAGDSALLPAASNYTWTFATAPLPDIVPPEVLAIFPGRDETARCQANAIAVRFTERMNEGSIDSTSFRVSIGGAPVPGNIAYNLVEGQTQATFATADGVPFTADSTVFVEVIGSPDGVEDLAGLGMVETYSWSFTIQPAQQCPTPVNLGAASPFGGFGGNAGLTNEGTFTVVNGDIGTTGECTTVTGFRDSAGDVYDGTAPPNDGFVNGIVYCAPPLPGTAEKSAIAIQALADANLAFQVLRDKPNGDLQGDSGQLAGLTLTPGVYKAADGTYEITGGNLTLNANGDPNAVWVFQAAETLTVGEIAGPVQVILTGEAKAENVFWQVGSSARIENQSEMVGTIIAQAGVTISTSGQVDLTTLDGRAIGLTASVTMVNTLISVPPSP